MKPHFRSTEFTKRPMEAKPVLLVTARPTVTHWATKPKAPK